MTNNPSENEPPKKTETETPEDPRQAQRKAEYEAKKVEIQEALDKTLKEIDVREGDEVAKVHEAMPDRAADDPEYKKAVEEAKKPFDEQRRKVDEEFARKFKELDEEYKDIVGTGPAKPREGLGERHSNIGKIEINVFAKNAESTRRASADQDKLVPINVLMLQKLAWVFVQPPRYQVVYGNRQQQRVFVVCGKRHTGRSSSAIHLGLSLLDLHPAGPSNGSSAEETPSSIEDLQNRIFIYRRSDNTDFSLVGFAKSKPVDDNKAHPSVYILENAFRSQADREDFNTYLDALTEALDDRQAYLILDSTEGLEALVDVKTGLLPAGVTADAKADVFDKHLKFYTKGSEEGITSKRLRKSQVIEELRFELLELLPYPFHIDLFFSRLCELPSQDATDRDKVRELAEQVGTFDQEPTRPWFRGLPANAQLYAMLVALFDRLERPILDEVYMLAVDRLRTQGLPEHYQDSRTIGLDDLLDMIHAEQREDKTVKFVADSFAAEVHTQIGNHQHLLWSLGQTLLELVMRDELYARPEYRELRVDLGAALGRLITARHHKLYERQLDQVLKNLAFHPNDQVALTSGYVLETICMEGGAHYFAFVGDLLQAWVNDEMTPNPYQRRTTALIIGRIYSVVARTAARMIATESDAEAKTLLDQLRSVLTDIAKHADEYGNTDYIRIEILLWMIGQIDKAMHALDEFLKPARDHIADLETAINQWRQELAELPFGDQGRRVRWRAIESAEAERDAFGETEDTIRLDVLKDITEQVLSSDEILPRLESLSLDDAERWVEKRRPELDRWLDQYFDAYHADEKKQEAADRWRECLNRVLDNFAIQTSNAVLVALVDMWSTQPREAVDQIQKWLEEDDDSPLHVMGLIAGYILFEINSEENTHLRPELHEPLFELIRPLLAAPAQSEMIQTILKTLRIWFKDAEWQPRIKAALLDVINTAPELDRAALRTGLLHLWLSDTDDHVRRTGQGLIARSYVISGVPMDMPGKRSLILAVDQSGLARQDRAGAHAGRELYHRLSPLVDVVTLIMGSANSVMAPAITIDEEALMMSADVPRLLYPPLLRTAEKIAPNDVHLLVALAWGDIHDLEDVWAGEWSRSRLLLARAAITKTEMPEGLPTVDLASLSTPQLSQLDDAQIDRIEQEVHRRLARALIALTPDDWFAALSSLLEATCGQPVDPNDREAISGCLDSWMLRLNEIPQETGLVDGARAVLCAVLWLARLDPAYCIGLLENWIKYEAEDQKTASLYHLMGRVCTRLLFNVYGQTIPPVDDFGPLMNLLPLLGKQTDLSIIEVVMSALEAWVKDRQWARQLESTLDMPLMEFIRLIPLRLHKSMLRHLENTWLKPADETQDEASKPKVSADEKEAALMLSRLGKRLQLRLLFGDQSTPLPPLEEGHQYGLILVDASMYLSPDSRTHLSKVASEVLKQLNQKAVDKLHLYTYRIGQMYPAALPGDLPKPSELLPDGLRGLPRLLAPVLDRYGREQVRFVCWLGNGPTIDQEDWIETWRSRLYIYSSRDETSWIESLNLNPIPKNEEPEKAAGAIIAALRL